ncbi:hypothetical protein [Clostridium sp. HBUAS56010]|uniref:hypothetical protein n=1 Tax=Clostridium sp. HBUAS56010 TaxID=2571127 RepID=UPI001178BDD3|nr:hypothetical protein [Clostridium sp. HBUAS56010]
MEQSKTIESLIKFYELISSTDVSPRAKEYVEYLPLRMAKSIIFDLGAKNAKKIANIILAVVDED